MKKGEKFLIFDAGPLISLTMNGLLPVLKNLKEKFPGHFVITPDVKREVVDRALKIKKYSLEGVKVRKMIEEGILEMSTDFVSRNELDSETQKVIRVINGSFREEKSGKKISIIHEGEASCIAFSNLCDCENMVVVDERTTRLLTEAPERLEKMMESKLHTRLDVNLEGLNELKKMRYIRSAELLYVAYKKGLVDYGKEKDVLGALLYAVKYRGAAISSREIEEMKKMK